MSAGIEVQSGQAIPRQGENRVVLHNVSYVTYEKLLADLASQSSPRLTYDRGVLEIMSPLPPHELLTDAIEMIVKMFALHTDTNLWCLRSTTFRRQDLERGFEPDSCFYVDNESRVRGKQVIDLNVDPPPDLVIEIDITSGSISKFPIYAQIGVPEIWRHDGDRLVIHRLTEVGRYTISDASAAFPDLGSAALTEFIGRTKDLPSTEFMRALMDWIKGTLDSGLRPKEQAKLD